MPKKKEKEPEKKEEEPVVETEEEPIVAPEEEVEVVEAIEDEDEEEKIAAKQRLRSDKLSWTPKTEVGKMVHRGELTSLAEILDSGKRILEPEIVDVLLPNIEVDLLMVGQSKGKFGGGKRRIFRQTQKKTREGNKPRFMTYAVVGNKDGFVGRGYGKSKETVPAREKAIRKAKLNIIKIRRGCGSWECNCREAHSIPFAVKGKCGSAEIILMPAPKGKGLIVESECRKMLDLAGIRDVWAKTRGQTKTKINLLNACFDALKKLSSTKVTSSAAEKMNIVDGPGGERVAG